MRWNDNNTLSMMVSIWELEEIRIKTLYTRVFKSFTAYVSNRVAQMAKKYGTISCLKCVRWLLVTRCAIMLIRVCKPIFKIDPSEMMLFQYMMKQKIVIPAHFLRESGEKIYLHSNSFLIQRSVSEFYCRLYMQEWMVKWEIDKITGLTDEQKKTRDY
jgi:acyl-[acyl-carrier-protein] desaturase